MPRDRKLRQDQIMRIVAKVLSDDKYFPPCMVFPLTIVILAGLKSRRHCLNGNGHEWSSEMTRDNPRGWTRCTKCGVYFVDTA